MTRARMMALLAAAVGTAAATAIAGAAKETSVDQVGQKFSAATLSVEVGDTVVFHNRDDVIHNINIIDAEGVPDDQGLQKPGEDIEKTFQVPGHYTVRCQIHPRMKMSIDVDQ